MAWTNAWDETRPADSDLANTLGVQLRAEKVDIRERLNFQHVWGVNTTDDGNHRNIVIPSAYMAANQEVLKASGFSLTGTNAQSMLELNGIWNTSGAPNGVLINLINTASSGGARPLNIKVGGVSVFSVDVAGNVTQAGSIGFSQSTVLKAVDYVLTASDDIVVFTAGNHNATLMTAIGRTKLVYIKNRGSGTITVLTTGGQTIDGVSSQTLLPGDALTFNSDGSNWSIV